MFSSSKKIRRTVEAMAQEVNELRTLVNDQAVRLEAETQRNSSVVGRIADIESRITGMGAELSRQLHELGADIDELSKRADDDATVIAIDALKATQIRLATEQARYEITFRRDLAELADQLLKRPK